jgi:hypothetical protein
MQKGVEQNTNSSEITFNTAHSNNNQQNKNITISMPVSTQMPFFQVTYLRLFSEYMVVVK